MASLSACQLFNYPQSAYLWGALGCTSALVFANLGSAFGTAKAASGVAHMGCSRPDQIMRGIVPVVMAGILGIYGLIVAVIINTGIDANAYLVAQAHLHLGSGLAAGLAALAAGLAIGIVGDTSVRAYGKQDKIFVAMILMLIFAEALGLYGLIIALLMNSQGQQFKNICTQA